MQHNPQGGSRTRPKRARRRAQRAGGLVLAAVALAGSVAAAAPSGASTTRSTSLASEVIPTPIGYEVSARTGSTPVSITPAVFDQWIGAGSSSSFGFMNGYDITFDATATSESIEITIYRFHSPAEAKAFESTGVSQSGAASLSPETKAIPGIKGSTALVSTTAGSDGFYLVDTWAVRGSLVMELVDANTDRPSSVPAAVSTDVVKQYKRLKALPTATPV